MRKNRPQPPSSLQKHAGQALPEYATTLALVTLFCIAALTALGNGISSHFIAFANYILTNVLGGGYHRLKAGPATDSTDKQAAV